MSALLPISRFVVPEVIAGRGAHRLVGRSAANLGATRVLVVTDAGVRAAGWTGSVVESLEAAGLEVVIFAAVTPNPRVAEVSAGAEAYRSGGCDAIVAVGGGSPVDCAKGIGIVTTNGGTIADYDGLDRVPRPIPPLVCVPTTAGASADVSQFAIITDPGRHSKFAVVSKTLVPDVSLLDPLPLTTQSATLTAMAGFDAISHAVEAIGSTAATPLCDLLALQAVRLLVDGVPRALRDPSDLAARAATMEGSLYAGMAFSNSSLGAAHAMAHALGGELDLPHGSALAALLPPVVAYNFPAVPQAYRRLGEALGIALPSDDVLAAAALAGRLRELIVGFGLATSLRQAGVDGARIPDLARSAAEDPCLATNPRCPTPADLERLYELAL